MDFRFELFGFYISKNVKSFWLCSIITDPFKNTDRNLLLFGRGDGRWFLELFGWWICGPKEFFDTAS